MSEYGTADSSMLGTSGYERREGDFYETPAWCTHALMRHVALPKYVWEPAAGRQAISGILRRYGHHVVDTDLHPTSSDIMGIDFLSATSDMQASDAIVTNPPYSRAKEFIERSLDLMAERNGIVCMLLRNEFDCAKTRINLFNEPPFAQKLVLTKRPKWIEGELKASPRHNFSWFIWDYRHVGPAILSYYEHVGGRASDQF